MPPFDSAKYVTLILVVSFFFYIPGSSSLCGQSRSMCGGCQIVKETPAISRIFCRVEAGDHPPVSPMTRSQKLHIRFSTGTWSFTVYLTASCLSVQPFWIASGFIFEHGSCRRGKLLLTPLMRRICSVYLSVT